MNSKSIPSFFFFFFFFFVLIDIMSSRILKAEASKTMVFREYIGSQFSNVSFTDVPINSSIPFHFILAFAIDYTSITSPTPTNGNFRPFWDTSTLSPSSVSHLKTHHSNVHVSLSLGGATVGDQNATFTPESVSSWVANAVSSLTPIIQEYNLDGIDIDYENFDADPETFAECVGRLIKILKKDGVISTASIAPYADDEVQRHYLQLWNKYGGYIDYVNFQFYAYDSSTTFAEFIGYFEEQTVKYKGGKVLASFISDWSKGLTAENGFFLACRELIKRRLLHGIFVWCADESKQFGFRYEVESQNLLAESV